MLCYVMHNLLCYGEGVEIQVCPAEEREGADTGVHAFGGCFKIPVFGFSP